MTDAISDANIIKVDFRRGTLIQYGALCWRPVKKTFEVLVITSLDTGRWIIPKGWPMLDRTPQGTAQQEAWEEAGIRGGVEKIPLGTYEYLKRISSGEDVQVETHVFALCVKEMSVASFPEKGRRKRKWMSRDRAADLVNEPGLKSILREFSPCGYSRNTCRAT